MSSHTLLLLRVGLHLSSEECFLLSHDISVLVYLRGQTSYQKNIYAFCPQTSSHSE